MKYRKFGKLDWEISELSSGVLRLEEIVSAPQEVNTDKRIAAIRCAIDHGVNYLNLGYPFYFKKPEESCKYIKEALADGYRDKIRLAINIPSRDITSKDDLDNSLADQLQWFELEKVDFCILDCVNRASWQKLKEIDVAAWANDVMSSGKADYMGITFHDDAYYLKEINDTYPNWAVVQIELSLLDYKHHPGVGGFTFTEQYGNAAVATDCTKSGRLLRNIPANVQQIWDQAKTWRSPAEWCVRWVLSFPEVTSVLMNFESPEQVKEYLPYADAIKPGDVDVMEILQATRVREAYYANRFIQCTACRCCMPCKQCMDVPRIAELYNDYIIFKDEKIPRFLFYLEGHDRRICIQCGQCTHNCPKHLPLGDLINDAVKIFLRQHN